MTTGSITTGSFPLVNTNKFHYAKSWVGGDGRTIAGQYGPQQKWNNYRMGMMRFRSTNSNRVGFKETATGVTGEADNHSWNKIGGDPKAQGYVALFGSEASSAFPTAQFELIFDARQELALLSKLLTKVKGHSLNLGVALAEVDKLANTIASTIHDLSKGVVYLSRGRYDQFARLFGAAPPDRKSHRRLQIADVGGRFLEMRYAWEPAIADAFEAAKAFEEISNGPRVSRTYKGRRVQSSTVLVTNYCDVPQKIEARRSYTYEMYEEMSVARQLGLANPASILWERCPWSFVVDWFIPIGTYLELIGQIPFMKGRWLRTDSIKWNASGKFPGRPFGGLEPFGIKPDCEMEIFNLQRVPLEGPPSVPHPTFRVAGAVQGKRLQNAVALAQQIFSKTALGQELGSFANILFDPTYEHRW